MKQFLIVLTIFTIPFSLQAQSLYGKGVKNISLSVGFPNTTHTAIDASNQLFNLNGDDSGSSTPLYMVNGTYGISENVAIGLYGGYFKSDSEILAVAGLVSSLLGTQSFGETEYSVFTVGGKLSVHEPIFTESEKLDTYASTYLGYNFVNDQINVRLLDENDAIIDIFGITLNANDLLNNVVSNVNYPKITYEVNAGAKYRVGENLSIFGEAGYGRFLVNAGLTYTMQ